MASGPEQPNPTRPGTLRNILLNAGWMLGGKGVGAVLSLAYLAIATRSLGLEKFGQFALVLGLAQGVAGFASFQSWQIVVRYGMTHIHAGRGEALTRLLRFSAALDVVSALGGALLATIGLLLLGPLFGWTSDFVWQSIATSAVFVLAVRSTPVGILRLHDRFGHAAGAETMIPIMRFLGAITVWLTGPSVVGFLIAWSAAEVVAALAYWALALRAESLVWRAASQRDWRAIRDENPGILAYAAQTNATSMLTVGGKQFAVLLVGLLVTPAAAGGFRVAQQLSQALGRFSTTLSRAIFPELMRSRAGEGDAQAFKLLFARTQRVAMIGGVIVVVFVLVGGRALLSLIAGEEFLPVYPMLLVLGIAGALDLASVGFEPALVAQGRAGIALRLRVIGTVTLVGVMVALTPRFGGMGAAFAVLTSSVLLLILSRFALRTKA